MAMVSKRNFLTHFLRLCTIMKTASHVLFLRKRMRTETTTMMKKRRQKFNKFAKTYTKLVESARRSMDLTTDLLTMLNTPTKQRTKKLYVTSSHPLSLEATAKLEKSLLEEATDMPKEATLPEDKSSSLLSSFLELSDLLYTQPCFTPTLPRTQSPTFLHKAELWLKCFLFTFIT